MKKTFTLVLMVVLCSFAFRLSSQEPSSSLKQAQQYYQNGQYDKAVEGYRGVIQNSAETSNHGEAYYWLSTSYFLLGQFSNAEKNLELFLQTYPTHSLYANGLYLKGRLLFTQDEFEKAITVFNQYIEEYSESTNIANVYFWIGESVYELGDFDSAEKVFRGLIQNYPASAKQEAAKYRIALIDLKKREEELLKLLKISHEESLKALEEFQKKEKTYEQAITVYQKKMADLQKTTESSDVDDLLQEIEANELKIDALKKQIQDLQGQLSGNTASTSDTQSTDLALQKRLLEAKEEALTLKGELLGIYEEK